ncbi:MAG: uroporphyrinogen decarboxylase family protein [Caldilineaceae bacterium]
MKRGINMVGRDYTPKERAIWALERKPPLPGLVPTFELEFQLGNELLGRDFYRGAEVWDGASPAARARMIRHNADLYIEVAERLDYAIIMIVGPHDPEGIAATANYIRDRVGDRYLLICHGDATFAIPDGNEMMEMAVAFFERAEEMHQLAQTRVQQALERGKYLREACGLDGFALCADYCFNRGPFLSPRMFRQFITPYLKELVAGYKELGYYVIKHTDGNLMPVLDQILESEPHGLHSIDCQAKDMDIAVIKQLAGDKVCLLGGVQCSLLQTGTEEQIQEQCKYVLRHAMPGGGYIYGTTNVAFKGLPLERYLLILEMRKRYGWYDEKGQLCPALLSEQ